MADWLDSEGAATVLCLGVVACLLLASTDPCVGLGIAWFAIGAGQHWQAAMGADLRSQPTTQPTHDQPSDNPLP